MLRDLRKAVCLLAAACGGPSASGDDATTALATTTEVTSGASTSTAVDTTADSTGEPGFDPCAEALFGRWDITEIDRAGDLEGDGVHEIAVLGRLIDTLELKVFVVTADAMQPGSGMLVDRVVQEIVFGPGFPTLEAAKIAGLGDVNGDGFPDLGVAVFVTDGSDTRTRVYVLLGAAVPLPVREIRVDGQDGEGWWLEGAPNQFTSGVEAVAESISLASVGDINGDGLGDVFVQPGDGRTFWIVFGKTDTSAPLVLGDLAATEEGFRVEYADDVSGMPRNAVPVGDVNGDGTLDLAVGNPSSYQSNGKVSIVFGTSPPSDADIRNASSSVRQVAGGIATFHLGSAVLGVGDRDGEPGDEIWVGSPAPRAVDPPCDVVTDADSPSHSLYLMRGGGAASFDSDQLLDGVAGSPLQGECGVGFDMGKGGDIDDDGVDDVAISTDDGELIWIDGAYLTTDGAVSPSTYAHRRVGACVGLDGQDFYPAGDGRRGVLPGPDITGDGVDDLVVLGRVLDPPPFRLMVLRGDPRWR